MIIRKHYNLFTALALIVGIVIGSGIFFKSDDILKYTGGSIYLGVVVFSLAAIAIIFGSLSIGELARRTDKTGGLIAYADEFVSPAFSAMIGWFQAFLYFPTIGVVVAWVVGIYITLLLDMNASLELQMLIGVVWFLASFVINLLSATLAGKLQVLATVVKLIPLFVIGLLTFVFGDLSKVTASAAATLATDSVHIEPVQGLAWLAAVGPVAFAFDGWVVATSISGELKHSKRNLPLALTLAPLIILAGYLLYFVGLTSFLGVDQVLALGDNSVSVAAGDLFGAMAGKILLTFVVVSVMGTVNGLILGAIRLPYALALQKRIPFADKLVQLSPQQIPVNAGLFMLAVSAFWFVVHYLTMKNGWLGHSDISELSIVVSYLLYVVFYAKVFLLWRQGAIANAFFGVIVPALATLGSLFILAGGVMQNPLFFPVCLPVCGLVLGAAFYYGKCKAPPADGSMA